jgi:hypothetical protein
MEQFLIETRRFTDNGDGTIYYELAPTNLALKDLILFGDECEINNTIEETLASEIALHKSSMFEFLQTYYPEIAIDYFL